MFDPELGMITSANTFGHFKKQKSPLVQITTWVGDMVKCTPDHQFMVWENKFVWKQAKDLVIHKDRIVMTPMCKTILSDIGITPTITINKIPMNLSVKSAKFFARLLGALHYNGGIIQKADGTFMAHYHFRSEQDFLDIKRDVLELGFNCPIKSDQPFSEKFISICLDPFASYYMVQLGAVFETKMKLRNHKQPIPAWIFTAPDSVKREFLSAMGYELNQYCCLSSSKSRKYTREICKLCMDIGIRAKYIPHHKKFIVISLDNEFPNIKRYYETLDYCYQEQRRRFFHLTFMYQSFQHAGINVPKQEFLEMFYLSTSKAFLMPICEIKSIPDDETYDFTTSSPHHNFIANSCVVHNCIPSRMTVALLLESMVSKVGAFDGKIHDATSFSGISMEDVSAELQKLGLHYRGNERLICGLTGKMLPAQIFVGPIYYQRLKHMVEDKIHCLKMDHEVLTGNGWKFFNEITMNDTIATLKDNKLVYDKPLELLYYPDFEGDMYHIANQQLDLFTTMNHRMWVSVGDKPFTWMEARDIVGKSVLYQNLEGTVSSENSVEEIVHRKEPVFCLRVPSEVFYVRRNGKAVWTGNSRGRGQMQIMEHQPLSGRSRNGGLRLGEMRKLCLKTFKLFLFILKESRYSDISVRLVKFYWLLNL
jgi:DNA-directed RNA polymerase, beta subunit/140 kD subunit